VPQQRRIWENSPRVTPGHRRKIPTPNRISRFASLGGLALTGLGLSADPAQAVPNTQPMVTWCPGQSLPDRGVRWDMKVCHNYFATKTGTGNVPMVDHGDNPIDSWFSDEVTPPDINYSARSAVLLSAGWTAFTTR
jgi:hypothetical protein